MARTPTALTPLLLLPLLAPAAPAADEPAAWATYRGNPQRTGCTDGTAGPAAPKVLWTHKAADHFVAAPVPSGDRLFVSGLGAFNVPIFLALDADPKAGKRVAWSKGTPALKLPTVSSPAVAGDKLVFGDGMHQTDGARLHCVRRDGGLPLWQLEVPGTLVHLEGSPTVSGGRVYLGGGAAGVLCVDLDRVTLDGKESDLPTIAKVLDARWAALKAKYEEEKKKDPDLAAPPSEDQLPKPAPLRVWQQGKDKWHVDAPVAVSGDRVLVASAFLDKEKVGDRALYCLDAKSGEILWRAPLQANPWGGPSVVGKVVVVSGSTIGYDPKVLKGAKGELAAFDLESGRQLWRKDVPGGVVGCAALTPELAVVTATDGKVRAFALATGERRWFYDARAPLFAPPALAGGVVYAADLGGVLHAVNLADGARKWALDVGADPAVKAPGMVYGGPVVSGGRLYVATCNLDGPHARQPTAVVCVGEK
jgi:outer membrane protein assembly factor BamB